MSFEIFKLKPPLVGKSPKAIATALAVEPLDVGIPLVADKKELEQFLGKKAMLTVQRTLARTPLCVRGEWVVRKAQ